MSIQAKREESTLAAGLLSCSQGWIGRIDRKRLFRFTCAGLGLTEIQAETETD